MKRAMTVVLAATLLLAASAFAQIQTFPSQSGSNLYTAAYPAIKYAQWQGAVVTGNSATGSQTVLVYTSGAFPDNRSAGVNPFQYLAPIAFVGETLTPTAVSCGQARPSGFAGPAGGFLCNITATFANLHSGNEVVRSGDGGLIEAAADAFANGGGEVDFDKSVGLSSATLATTLGAAPVFPTVYFKDSTNFAVQYWTAQGGLTTLAAPATLTAVTVGFGLNGANTTGGTYTGTSTYDVCIAYVDIMGQEGPCSATFTALTAGTGATNQIGFAAPAASSGAVGYTIYISLASGASNLHYKVPLATYAGGVRTSAGVCTLTSIETVTAACAVTNSTYSQTGSTAQVSALTVNTSPIQPQVTVVSTTAIYVPNAGGRTAYAYVPGSHIGYPGLPAAILPFTISAADATTVPSVLGTINVPANFMNYVGRTIEVCGKATTTASTATIGSIAFQWDSIGQNTAGKGVVIGNLGLTPATAFATTAVYTFCEDFQTTVSGAGATAGSINTIGGFLNTSGVATAAAGQGASSDPSIGATGSLNLANEARLNVTYTHTIGTDGAGLTLQSLTVKVIN